MTTETIADRPARRGQRALSWRILAALIVGLLAGAGLAASGFGGLDVALGIAAPIGRLWLNALTMTVVPLVFGLLVTGIADAAATSASGGLAKRALAWFAILLLAAAALSALVMTTLLALWPIGAQPGLTTIAGTPLPSAPDSDWTRAIIPTNPIKAAADTAMVPLVVFALLFGLAVARIAPPLRDSLLTVFRALTEAMLVIVHWVLWLAPIGVLALAFAVGAQLGLGAAGTLLHYVALVAACCLSAAVLASMAAIIFGRINPLAFARAVLPAQIVAVSTQSSLASLPAMIEAAPAEVAREPAGVVLPLAVSLFRAASAAGNLAVALYLAHLHGVALDPALVAIGIVTAAAVSLAAVGLPAQVSFFATIAPVCIAMGVPIALLPVLLAVETIPDIFRTLGNVTADLAVTRLAGRDRSDSGSA